MVIVIIYLIISRKGQFSGISVFDAYYLEEVLVIPSVLALLGDNPMQSEFACHAGLRAKFFCRICMVKGKDKDDQETDDAGRQEPFNVIVDRIKRFIRVILIL